MNFEFAHEPDYAHVFADILGALDRAADRSKKSVPTIDTVAFLERVTPVMKMFDGLTRPHLMQRQEGPANAPKSRYYVFATGLTSRGTMAYRIVHINARRQLNILNIGRLLSTSELFRNSKTITGARRKEIESINRNHSIHLEATLQKGLPFIARTLDQQKQWGRDVGFLIEADPKAYKLMNSAHEKFAGDMLSALEDLIPDYDQYSVMKASLQEALEKFSARRMQDEIVLLQDAAASLNPEVTRLFDGIPSARTVTNYNWLAHTNDHVTAARRTLIKLCPVILLIDDYARHPVIQKLDTTRELDRKSARDHLKKLFGLHADHNIRLLEKLREKDIGTDVARLLPAITPFLEYHDYYHRRLKDPRDWTLLRNLISASKQTAKVVGRTEQAVFLDLARSDDPYKSDDFIARHFNTANRNHYQRLTDLKILRNRLARWVIVPKIVTEGKVERIIIPVRHAFYIAAQGDLLNFEAIKTIPKKIRQVADAANGKRRLNDILQESVRVPRLLDYAFDFATHRGPEEIADREKVFIKRMAAHAADYPFPTLPSLQVDMGYRFVPIHNQAELAEICWPTQNPLFYEGVDAISKNAYFVGLQDKSHDTLAVGKINGDDWSLEKVVEMSRHGTNRNYDVMFEEYLEQLHEKRAPDASLANARATISNQILSTATDAEMLGFNPDNIQDKIRKLNEVTPYLGMDFDIDELGCLHTPEFTEAVRKVVSAVKPYYRPMRALPLLSPPN